jgi:hypothetical protein
MRVISYFILFAFFLQVSCTKTLPSSGSASNKMIGTWKVSNQVSGIRCLALSPAGILARV